MAMFCTFIGMIVDFSFGGCVYAVLYIVRLVAAGYSLLFFGVNVVVASFVTLCFGTEGVCYICGLFVYFNTYRETEIEFKVQFNVRVSKR